MQKLIFLELNEINFDDLHVYMEQGKLPNFSHLIQAHGFTETVSETQYDHLEPWIQWVSAHTGLSYDQHCVFRLGDFVSHDLPQIWEVLEAQGVTVGAISPMNADNRCKQPAFFVPDPWTKAPVTGSPILKELHAALSQVVNDNAQSRYTLRSLFGLLLGAARYARFQNYPKYLRFVLGSRAKSFMKPLFLDALLADVFISQINKKKPTFSTLFLNAGAHIQHHYMFNSPAYKGSVVNPDWYLPRDIDPVLEVYQLYDDVIRQITKAAPKARLMIATGLHQEPHPSITFYWRLRNHSDFLTKHGIPFQSVTPLMSRDFLVTCRNAAEALIAEKKMLQMREAASKDPIFILDNRGTELFVMLSYPRDIGDDFVLHYDGEDVLGFKDDISFVAIKNGMHSGTGYFLDSSMKPEGLPSSIALTELPQHICGALGVKWDTSSLARQ